MTACTPSPTKDRLESAGDLFHERTRLFFLDLARREPERYLVLNARASREEIAAQVAARVAPLLSCRSPPMTSVIDGTVVSWLRR